MAEILGSRPFNISIRRSLVAGNLHDWHDLVLKLSSINLTDSSDCFKWSLNSNGRFTINSMYQAFLDTNVVPNNTYLWKIKIPLKIKVFLWLLHRETILTKDNLAKRKWNGNVMCCCDSYETIQQLFFECVLAKFIWRVIQITFGLTIPWNIKHVFGNWVQRMNVKDRKLFYVGMDVIDRKLKLQVYLGVHRDRLGQHQVGLNLLNR
jgi:hypothetical protein